MKKSAFRRLALYRETLQQLSTQDSRAVAAATGDTDCHGATCRRSDGMTVCHLISIETGYGCPWPESYAGYPGCTAEV